MTRAGGGRWIRSFGLWSNRQDTSYSAILASGDIFRTTAAVKRDIDVVRRLTSRPFAINHIPQTLDAEAFRYTLEARPAVISFALADPGDLVGRPTMSGRS